MFWVYLLISISLERKPIQPALVHSTHSSLHCWVRQRTIATMSLQKTSLLYANSDSTVLLIDIPTSLSLAQGLSDQRNTHRLYSSTALEEPHPSTEPKSEAAKANVLRMLGPVSSNVDEDATMQGLERIRVTHTGLWCYPREISTDLQVEPSRKHRRKDLNSMSNQRRGDPGPGDLCLPSNSEYGRYRNPLILSSMCGFGAVHVTDMQSMVHRLVHNPYPSVQTLSISSKSYRFRIPGKASFYLTNITPSTTEAFTASAKMFYSTPTSTAGLGQFDFVLLDPPWENRSAHRSRKYATRQAVDPMGVLESSLEPHLAPNALVACWITNKLSVRQAALKAFECWDVEFQAQWVWLKVTVNGDPVTDINGTWRKPYECLLLGRKRGDKGLSHDVRQDTLRPRVLVGVPDLHSRKPSVKELIEPLMEDSSSYRALEVFARNLTAGWWALGNEVLKYNSEDYWFGAE